MEDARHRWACTRGWSPVDALKGECVGDERFGPLDGLCLPEIDRSCGSGSCSRSNVPSGWPEREGTGVDGPGRTERRWSEESPTRTPAELRSLLDEIVLEVARRILAAGLDALLQDRQAQASLIAADRPVGEVAGARGQRPTWG